MKKLLLSLILAMFIVPLMAETTETKKYDFGFYGFLRTDFYYNNRTSAGGFNELFYLYPLDIELDAEGNDINDTSTSGIYSFVTRMGLDLKGPNVGKATASGKIEVDFAGYGDMNTLLRIRHAYLKLDWESGSSLTVGQTWHPLFGSYMPSMVNLNTGAPFQPFSRSPQLQYNYNTHGFKFIAAALYQLQYTSSGPEGYSNDYQMASNVPELYLGVDYSHNGWLFGGGLNLLTLAPRTESVVDGLTYKVKERMSALTGEVHTSYIGGKVKFGMKSLLASSLDHTMLIGGYGVTSVSGTNGEQEYVPLKNSTTWVNFVYGKTWTPRIFVGYTKNLGSSESLVSLDKIYGRGTDIDQLLGVNIGLSYNKPHWMTAIEYTSTTAWYGDIDLDTGRVNNTHDVTTGRITAIFTYLF